VRPLLLFEAILLLFSFGVEIGGRGMPESERLRVQYRVSMRCQVKSSMAATMQCTVEAGRGLGLGLQPPHFNRFLCALLHRDKDGSDI
jgi:hypothetical protein